MHRRTRTMHDTNPHAHIAVCSAGKWKAVVTEILRFHKQGRPILVGTTSVESSEALAERLRDQSASCSRTPAHVYGSVQPATRLLGAGQDL